MSEALGSGATPHAAYGMDVRNQRGTKGKTARAGEMVQVLLTCDRITGQKVVLEARVGVTVV